MKGLSDLLKQFVPQSAQHYDKSSKSKAREQVASEVFDFLALVKQWEGIAGTKLAKHTVPIKNSQGVLTILTDHPAYGQELSFLQQALIKKIENVFPSLKGKIKRLLFQNDPTFFKQKVESYQKMAQLSKEASAPRFHPQSPEYKNAKKQALEIYAHITDEEMRDALVSLHIQLSLN